MTDKISMLCFNINAVLHAKFTQFRIVCKPQTHDPRVALNLNLFAQIRKSRRLCCCACDHAEMNSSNPVFSDAFFSAALGNQPITGCVYSPASSLIGLLLRAKLSAHVAWPSRM